MDRLKDWIIEKMEEVDDEELAGKLGITYEELIKLNHRIDIGESNEGFFYNYIISFDVNAPKEILSKIIGLNESNKICLEPWNSNKDDD